MPEDRRVDSFTEQAPTNAERVRPTSSHQEARDEAQRLEQHSEPAEDDEGLSRSDDD